MHACKGKQINIRNSIWLLSILLDSSSHICDMASRELKQKLVAGKLLAEWFAVEVYSFFMHSQGMDVFLSLRVFGLLSSSLLLFPQRFSRYVLRPSSGVCRTREPSRNFELRPLLNPRGSLF